MGQHVFFWVASCLAASWYSRCTDEEEYYYVLTRVHMCSNVTHKDYCTTLLEGGRPSTEMRTAQHLNGAVLLLGAALCSVAYIIFAALLPDLFQRSSDSWT